MFVDIHTRGQLCVCMYIYIYTQHMYYIYIYKCVLIPKKKLDRQTLSWNLLLSFCLGDCLTVYAIICPAASLSPKKEAIWGTAYFWDYPYIYIYTHIYTYTYDYVYIYMC